MQYPPYYILKDKQPIPEPDVLKWDSWMETHNMHVADEECKGVRISTVFLGIDRSFWADTPLLFETMVFGGSFDGHQERCYTWAQAERQHNKAVKMVRQSQTKSIWKILKSSLKSVMRRLNCFALSITKRGKKS